MQFPLPDIGHMVLPFFSEETQARVAAGTTAKVVALTGRDLFELTRGATLMLNPNGTNCTLYPEEIAALLDRGEVAIVDKFTVPEPKLMDFREPEPSPTWRSEEHTSELQSLMRKSYAVLCLKKKKIHE